jgi:hypothetical protein
VPILYKGKGKDPNVYNSHRPIWLLIFVFKCLEACWAIKYGAKLEAFNSESQFLFRRWRGCEDVQMLLCLTRDRLLDMGKNAFFLYNDYKNAFQDVAQVGGLEAGLWAAKVPHKGIAIFRLIHTFVGGIVQLRSAAGVIRSKIPFKPSRGGLAGSITMPSMFNCAVANMLRQRDTNRKGGVGPGEADLGLPTKECIVCSMAPWL